MYKPDRTSLPVVEHACATAGELMEELLPRTRNRPAPLAGSVLSRAGQR